MRAHWGPKDLQAATDGGLVFTSRQAKVIRAEVVKRVGQRKQSLGLSGASSAIGLPMTGRGQVTLGWREMK